jgi:hypothetical protein
LGHHVSEWDEFGKVLFITDRIVGDFFVLIPSCNADYVSGFEFVAGLGDPLVKFIYINLVRGQCHGAVADEGLNSLDRDGVT